VSTLPTIDQTTHLVRRLASLYHRLGHEIGTRPLVLPDAKFFPDVFTADEKSVRKLARRMMAHAGMTDIPIKVRVLGLDATGAVPNQEKGCCGGSSHSTPSEHSDSDTSSHGHKHEGHDENHNCGGGGCGNCAPTPTLEAQEPRLVDVGEEWLIQVPAAEVRSDIVLTTNLAKTLGLIFLLENLPKGSAIEEPVEASIEIASIALGFGALLLEGSYIYSKSCGGPKIGRITTLDCGSVAVLTALFVARGQHSSRPLRQHLGTTQLAAYGEAEVLVSANRALVERLSSAPESLISGDISIRTSVSVWERLFGKRPRTPDPSRSAELDLDALEAMITTQSATQVPKQRRATDSKHAELRALVDDALAESGEEA